MNNKEYLNRLFESDKPLIIYKVAKGFDVYTDFSDKIKINKNNINYFFKKVTSFGKTKNKFFDGYIGFFGYELLCELIDVKIPNQKTNNFYKSIFYKPQTVIRLRKKILVKSTLKNFKDIKYLQLSSRKYFYQKKFNVNLDLQQYSNHQ